MFFNGAKVQKIMKEKFPVLLFSLLKKPAMISA